MNSSCSYDSAMTCFSVEDCKFLSQLECLKAGLYLAQKELVILKQKRNLRHTKTSLKWRDSAFYYKKRAKTLTGWIKAKGLALPTIQEFSDAQEKEEIDGKILNSIQGTGAG